MLTARQEELSRELPATDFFSGNPQAVYEKTQGYFSLAARSWMHQFIEDETIVPWHRSPEETHEFATAWNPSQIEIIIPIH